MQTKQPMATYKQIRSKSFWAGMSGMMAATAFSMAMQPRKRRPHKTYLSLEKKICTLVFLLAIGVENFDWGLCWRLIVTEITNKLNQDLALLFWLFHVRGHILLLSKLPSTGNGGSGDWVVLGIWWVNGQEFSGWVGKKGEQFGIGCYKLLFLSLCVNWAFGQSHEGRYTI